MANFEGEVANLPFRVNAGLRYVSTEQSSTAPLINASDNVRYESDYSNVLPSLTLSLDLTDDAITRFSASKVLVRPKLTASQC